MITVSRLLIHQVRAVFRRLVRKDALGPSLVSLHAGDDGLRIRLRQLGAQAELHQPGSFSAEAVTLSVAALDDFHGRRGMVALQAADGATVEARWDEAG